MNDKREIDENETNSCIFLKRQKLDAVDEEPYKRNDAVEDAVGEEHLKENVIRYYLMPSLQHLAAVKIAITLWSRAGIQDEIRKLCRKKSINCRRCERYHEYLTLDESGQEIKNKVLNIVLLELSKFDDIWKTVSDLVYPIGQEIFDWIEYQDRHVFHNDFTNRDLSVNYLDCQRWTARGIIDYEETAKVLLAKKELTDTNAYHLACTYCFEEDAKRILPNVKDRINYYIQQPNYDSKTMVYFWSARLEKDFTQITKCFRRYKMKYETGYSINEYLFHVLACNKKHCNNQAAIKFMWNMLSDEEKSRQILTVMKYSKTDLKCFFLSQMNEVQQQQAFKTESREMLLCLLDDWLWKDYFLLTMHHVWDIIPEFDFLCVVEDIVKRRMERYYEEVEEYNRYKAILEELWRSAPKHLKKFIFEFKNGSRGSGIFFGLLCARNMDIIQLMLLDVSDVQMKTMIFSSCSNYRKCYWLIINDQMDVVKRFIDSTLFTENDVDMFNQKLVEGYGCEISVHFIQNQKWDEVDRFMQWVFKSDHDKTEFKSKLSYTKICDDILESIVAKNNEGGFTELEDFFLWCASESTEKVFELKREMYKVYFETVHCKLIEENKYQLLEKFLNWCFSNDEYQAEFTKRLYVYNKYIQTEQLVLNLVEKNNRLLPLKKFVHWCFTEREEIAKFKKWILKPGRGITVGVCINLLCKDMFELAEEFVCWCCDFSKIEIREFKDRLMLFDGIKYLFTQYAHDDEMLKKIMKWFNPSKKTIIQFWKKFEDIRWIEMLTGCI